MRRLRHNVRVRLLTILLIWGHVVSILAMKAGIGTGPWSDAVERMAEESGDPELEAQHREWLPVVEIDGPSAAIRSPIARRLASSVARGVSSGTSMAKRFRKTAVRPSAW